MRLLLVSLAFVLGVVGGVPGLADAKPKVGLLAISGDEDGDIADAVAEALDGDKLSIVYPNAITRVIDKLGYDEDDLSEKQARKVATELEADALIQAKYAKEGKRKTLRFKLYVGGKKVRGFKVTFNNAKSDNFQLQLRDKVVERVRGGAAVARADDEEDDESPKKKKKKKRGGDDEDADDEDEEDDEDDGKKKKKKVARGDDEDEDDEDPDDDEDDEIEASVRRVSPHAANRVAIRLDVGGSFQNRRLVFTSRNNFPEAPKPYSNSPVAGVRVEAELYPFAFMNPKSVAAGLGFAAEYDKTVSLTLRTSAEPTVPVSANQSHWSVGARYRIPFGGKPTSPTLTIGAGFGKRTFTTDRGPLMDPASLDVPDTAYTVIDPGLAFRIPVAKFLALTLSGRALVIIDAGPIQDPESYGQAKVFGGAGQAGIDIVLGSRFAIRIVGEFTQVGFAFTGNGDLSNGRDRDPTSKDVGGAADRSIGGAATLAVHY